MTLSDKKLYRFFLFFFFFLKYINYSENKNNTLTSKKQCRVGIEISATAKEVATIKKKSHQSVSSKQA